MYAYEERSLTFAYFCAPCSVPSFTIPEIYICNNRFYIPFWKLKLLFSSPPVAFLCHGNTLMESGHSQTACHLFISCQYCCMKGIDENVFFETALVLCLLATFLGHSVVQETISWRRIFIPFMDLLRILWRAFLDMIFLLTLKVSTIIQHNISLEKSHCELFLIPLPPISSKTISHSVDRKYLDVQRQMNIFPSFYLHLSILTCILFGWPSTIICARKWSSESS